MAGTTGLEPATSAVTGQRSNQMNYVPAEWASHGWWAVSDSNGGPSGCKPKALTAELTAPHHRTGSTEHRECTAFLEAFSRPDTTSRVSFSLWSGLHGLRSLF